MFKLKKDDYLASLNRARRKRNRGDYKKYALIAAGAVVIIGAVVFAGLKLGNRETGGKPGESAESVNETAVNPEEESKATEAAEKKAVVDSYSNLGIVQVTGYLNMRESASTDADVIGKLQGDSACEILDDSTEGWYQISSGGLTGYISSEFVLTGEEAKAKAEELVALRAIITVDALNIRKEPTTESDAVGQALKNERYVIEEDTGDGWLKIPSGYIASEFVEQKYALNEARKLDMKSMVLNLYKNIGISSVDNLSLIHI